MKSRNAYVLGIDLGGTQVRAALTGPDGMLATPLQAVPTEAHTLEREALYARIRDLAITVRGKVLRDGTVEDYLSGTALSQHFTALTGETVSGKEVAARAHIRVALSSLGSARASWGSATT